MIFRYLLIIIILFPIKAFALIEVDITRGNLSPLPIAVSPLSIDEKSKESFKKILKKKNTCKNAEYLQSRILQFKTNYWNFNKAKKQAIILKKTVDFFK